MAFIFVSIVGGMRLMEPADVVVTSVTRPRDDSIPGEIEYCAGGNVLGITTTLELQVAWLAPSPSRGVAVS